MSVSAEKKLNRVVNFIYYNQERIYQGVQAVYFHHNIPLDQAYDLIQDYLAKNKDYFSSVEKISNFFVSKLYNNPNTRTDFYEDCMHMLVFSVYRTDFGKGSEHVKQLIKKDIVKYWDEPI